MALEMCSRTRKAPSFSCESCSQGLLATSELKSCSRSYVQEGILSVELDVGWIGLVLSKLDD